MRYALGTFAALLAAAGAMATENVVVIDVTGTWKRVSAAGQSLNRYQQVPARERIRFVISEPFVPGTLVLADSAGVLYYSKECKSPEPCEGVLEVPDPPRNTIPGNAAPSVLAKLFKPLTDLIGRDDHRWVALIGNQAPMGGILRDVVLLLKGDSVDLCESVGAMNRGQYSVRLSSPSGVEFAGQLKWDGNCPAHVRLQGLTPGTYTIKTLDSHGAGDTALALVCSSDGYQAAKEEFRELSNATQGWVQAGSERPAIRESARRGFLAGYLLWQRVSSDATPPDASRKRDR
jgi:hypothetical protein